MSQIPRITGSGLPLRGDDIDTDRIIPARFLRCVTFDGLGDRAFEDDRAQMGGQHPFDLPQYQNASILVVNRNFGCGSSREHAPQSLNRWGIQALVGESFAEIFFANCIAMGIPCAIAQSEAIAQLQQRLEDEPTATLTMALDALQITCGDLTLPIEMKDGPRQSFLSGTWDSCGQLVDRLESVKATADTLPYLQWSPG